MICDRKLYICNNNGEKYFGKGPYDLLVNIDKYHSINKAASEMYMSYHKALNLISTAEKGFGCSLVVTQAGGRQGGGSKLTEEALEILSLYRKWEDSVSRLTEESFNSIFASFMSRHPE